MATRVGCGGNRLASFNSPAPKLPIRCKNLGDIDYRIRIIALMSQISLPWQQESVRVKFYWQYLMAQPPKPTYRCKDLADISSKSWVIAHCVPNFIAMATSESGVNSNDTVRLAIPKNHTIEPKILTLSYTQPKL